MTAFAVGDRVKLVSMVGMRKDQCALGDEGTVYKLYGGKDDQPYVEWDRGYKSRGWYTSNYLEHVDNSAENIPEEW